MSVFAIPVVVLIAVVACLLLIVLIGVNILLIRWVCKRRRKIRQENNDGISNSSNNLNQRHQNNSYLNRTYATAVRSTTRNHNFQRTVQADDMDTEITDLCQIADVEYEFNTLYRGNRTSDTDNDFSNEYSHIGENKQSNYTYASTSAIPSGLNKQSSATYASTSAVPRLDKQSSDTYASTSSVSGLDKQLSDMYASTSAVSSGFNKQSRNTYASTSAMPGFNKQSSDTYVSTSAVPQLNKQSTDLYSVTSAMPEIRMDEEICVNTSVEETSTGNKVWRGKKRASNMFNSNKKHKKFIPTPMPRGNKLKVNTLKSDFGSLDDLEIYENTEKNSKSGLSTEGNAIDNLQIYENTEDTLYSNLS